MNTSWLKRGRTLGLLFLTALLVMLPLAGCQRSGDAGNGMRKVNGQEIKLRLLARSDTPSTVRSAEMVAQYLHAVGIGAEIIAVDSATWVAKKDAKEYDIVFFRATPWGNMMHASHGTGYFDSRRTGQGVLHNLDAQDYLDACDARLNTAIADEQRTLDLQLQQMHHDYLPGLALTWIESVYPYRTGWDNWVIDHIYGGVVNSFSWFTVTQNASADDLVLRVGSTKPFKTTNKFSDYWYGVLSGITTHDSLIKLDTNMQPAPWLATSWEVSADSKQFTFTIAEGVKWHDGIPLTPEDVKFSIEYHRDKIASSAWMKEIIDNVQVDGRNVIINLVIPYGNLLTEFMTYHPIPKHIWEDVDDPDSYNGADRVIGSGPFKLDSWNETAGKFTFTANDDYFQGRPNVDRLVVDVYKNMDALVMSLSRGNIDTWWDYSGEFPYTHVSTLQGTDKIEFASATFLGVPAAIGFNLDVSPTNELAFRQAVAKAINYEQIAELVFDDYGIVPTYGFAPSTHPNFNDSIPSLQHDPAAANALLDGLGFVDTTGNGKREAGGQEIKLRLLARSDTPSTVRCAEMVKQYFQAVGIGAEITSVDSATWVAKKDAMEYDIVFFRATPWGNMMHASHGSGYFDSRRTGQGVLHNLNAQDYLDTCDARLETAVADQQRTLDLQLQQMHHDYLPGLALAWIDSVYPYRTGWDNWVIDHIYGGVVNSFSWSTVTRTAG